MTPIYVALAISLVGHPSSSPPRAQAAQTSPAPASAEAFWGTLVGLSGREWTGEGMSHRFVWDPATQTLEWQRRSSPANGWTKHYRLVRTPAGIADTSGPSVGADLRLGDDGTAVIRTREFIPLNTSFRAEGEGYRVTYNPFGQNFLMTPVADGWTGPSLAAADSPAPSRAPSGPIILSASGATGTSPARAATPPPVPPAGSGSPGPIVLAAAPPPAAVMRQAPAPGSSPQPSAPTSREAQMATQVQTRRVQAAREAEAERIRQAEIAEQQRQAEEARRAREAQNAAGWGEALGFVGALVGGVAAGTATGGDMTAISAGMAAGSALSAPNSEIAAATNSNFEVERQRYEEQRAFEQRVIAELHNPDNPLTQQARAEEEERKTKYEADMAALAREQREMEARHALEREQLQQENNRSAANQQAEQRAQDERREQEQRQAAEQRRREEEAETRRRQEEERLQQEEERRQAAERERQAREEQQRREAEARRLEQERIAAERNRLVDFKEAVVLCELSGPQAQFGNWDCEGPLQQNYVNFDNPNVASAMRLMDCSSYRELPRAGAYRVFACGYGLHPTNPAPSRNVPEMLGVFVEGRAVFRCPVSSTSVCRTR